MGTTTSYSANYAPSVKPYVENMLGKAEALTNAPYQTYSGERVAGFDPMQLQAQQAVANMQPSQQIGSATQLAGLAGLAAGNTSYAPGTYGNYYSSPSAYKAGSFNAPTAQAAKLSAAPTGRAALSGYDTGRLNQYQMGPAERVGTQSFLQPGTTDAYMSPYMQSVVNAQKREAIRQSNIMQQQNQAQAVAAGAYGGSRQAIVEAERQRNLGTQLGDIQATGSQAAFQNAQQQFNQEQQARLQANLANQQAGLTVGQQNLAALLGVQQLGYQGGLQQSLANQQALNQMGLANLNMAGQYGLQQGQFQQQANLANQQAGLTAQQLAEQSRQFGYGQQMNAAQLAAQYGLQGDQLSEQSRQFGANLGMQGIQQQLAAAGQLGNLGQLEFNQQAGIINAMNAAGAQRQGLQQQQYDTAYQDFQRQIQYPYQNLAFMRDMISSTQMPLSQTQQTTASSPSVASQVAGAGAVGKYFNLFAEGGKIEDSGRSSGLADLLVHSMRG